MYIAMNRFKVTKGSEEDFETVWKTRDSQLDQVPGFVEFRLLKGPEAEDTRSTPRTRSGRTTKPSSPGPNPIISARPTPTQATPTGNRSIRATRSSRALRRFRSSDQLCFGFEMHGAPVPDGAGAFMWGDWVP